MTAHAQHRHLSHPHPTEEREELSTVRLYVPLAKAAGTPERAAAGPPRREADGGPSPPAAEFAADATPCKEVQGREIEPFDTDESHASECNEMQGRENELSARDDSYASPCKEMQSPKINAPAAAEGPANECKVLQASENNLPAKPDGTARERQDLSSTPNSAFRIPHSHDSRSTTAPVASPPAADLSAALSELLSEQAKLVLSQRQQTAIGLLLAGHRDVDVAGKVGVHPATIWRWKQNRHFRASLEEARDIAFGSAIDRLRGLAPQAVDILHERLQAGDRTAALQLLRLIRVDRIT